jgi:hypothetical protein
MGGVEGALDAVGVEKGEGTRKAGSDEGGTFLKGVRRHRVKREGGSGGDHLSDEGVRAGGSGAMLGRLADGGTG